MHSLCPYRKQVEKHKTRLSGRFLLLLILLLLFSPPTFFSSFFFVRYPDCLVCTVRFTHVHKQQQLASYPIIFLLSQEEKKYKTIGNDLECLFTVQVERLICDSDMIKQNTTDNNKQQQKKTPIDGAPIVQSPNPTEPNPHSVSAQEYVLF